MKKIKIIKTVSVAAFTTTLLFASCTGNFDELNTHPTDVYPEDMTPTERVGTLSAHRTNGGTVWRVFRDNCSLEWH